MSIRSVVGTLTRLAITPVLIAAVGVAVAQPPDNHDHDNHHPDQGKDFHFRDQDRGQFQSHYNKDAAHWHGNPHRPHFTRGERIPNNYRFQPVPRTYYSNVPPPPAGYQYGYYDGYVVAYNPTTRIIADVMDLAAAAAR